MMAFLWDGIGAVEAEMQKAMKEIYGKQGKSISSKENGMDGLMSIALYGKEVKVVIRNTNIDLV